MQNIISLPATVLLGEPLVGDPRSSTSGIPALRGRLIALIRSLGPLLRFDASLADQTIDATGAGELLRRR